MMMTITRDMTVIPSDNKHDNMEEEYETDEEDIDVGSNNEYCRLVI